MPGSIIVNCARGGIIQEQALADALHSGHLAGAGLDVVEPAPPPDDHPLLHAPNIIITPHTAFFSQASTIELERRTAQEALRVLNGNNTRKPHQPRRVGKEPRRNLIPPSPSRSEGDACKRSEHAGGARPPKRKHHHHKKPKTPSNVGAVREPPLRYRDHNQSPLPRPLPLPLSGGD